MTTPLSGAFIPPGLDLTEGPEFWAWRFGIAISWTLLVLGAVTAIRIIWRLIK